MLNSTHTSYAIPDTSCTRGVLLVEMLAAFALVSVTLVVAVGMFVASSRAGAVAQRRVEVADAMAFALADITREARASADYQSLDDGHRFTMTRVAGLNGQNAATVSYFILHDSLMKEVNGEYLPLTPTGLLEVQDLWVETYQVGNPAVGQRASVRMSVVHTLADPDEEPALLLHTSFTSRHFDE